MGKSSCCFPCMHTIIMVATITAMVTISIIMVMVNTTITITTITTMVTIATTSLPVCASWDFPELPPSSLTKSSPPLYISKTPAPWGIYHKIHWTFSMNIVWQFVLSPSACLANTCFVMMNIGILWQFLNLNNFSLVLIATRSWHGNPILCIFWSLCTCPRMIMGSLCNYHAIIQTLMNDRGA